MTVEVKLFASLRTRFPETRGRSKIELGAHASLLDLIEQLEIPDRMAQMVLVNGQQAKRDRESRAAHRLKEGDVVAIFPPVAGG